MEVAVGLELDNDIKIDTGAEKEESFAMTGSVDFERLTTLEKRDATGFICVKAVVYEDGAQQKFE